MAFSNILPDPVNKITNAGVADNTNGTAGPGFASVSLRSVRDTQVSRTISGRGVTRSQGSQMFDIDIQYNPMSRAEFEPVFSFLLSRNARRTPFYVQLPQYASPRNATWATFVTANAITTSAANNAGSTNMLITNASMVAGSGDPSPGDMFTITDSTNTNHTKAYLITRVENSTVFESGGGTVAVNSRRIHFVPPLTKTTPAGATVNFIAPKIRCILKSDIQEYSLNTNNLFQFTLNLEEIQP
jgi:hypothetical protein